MRRDPPDPDQKRDAWANGDVDHWRAPQPTKVGFVLYPALPSDVVWKNWPWWWTFHWDCLIYGSVPAKQEHDERQGHRRVTAPVLYI